MRAGQIATAPVSAIFPAGTYSWRVPSSGIYRIAVWGGSAGYLGSLYGQQGGGSGSFILAERPLAAGAVLSITVGNFPLWSSSVALPNGNVFNAGDGGWVDPGDGNYISKAGVASITGPVFPTDIILDGSLGGSGPNVAGAAGKGTGGGAGGVGNFSFGGGAGAPGWGEYRGGRGNDAAGQPGPVTPGGGSSGSGSGNPPGSQGLVIIDQIRSV